jgi:hypothetical protein
MVILLHAECPKCVLIIRIGCNVPVEFLGTDGF